MRGPRAAGLGRRGGRRGGGGGGRRGWGAARGERCGAGELRDCDVAEEGGGGIEELGDSWWVLHGDSFYLGVLGERILNRPTSLTDARRAIIALSTLFSRPRRSHFGMSAHMIPQ